MKIEITNLKIHGTHILRPGERYDVTGVSDTSNGGIKGYAIKHNNSPLFVRAEDAKEINE